MLVLGFARPTSGAVLYNGRNIWAMSSAEFQTYRREVQAIFQDPFAVYNPFYTVDRLLLSPLKSFGLAKNKAQALPQIEGALEQVGLRAGDVLGRYPHQLSGGQRQRLTVARSPAAQAAADRGRRAGVDDRRLAACHHPRRAA